MRRQRLKQSRTEEHQDQEEQILKGFLTLEIVDRDLNNVSPVSTEDQSN